MNPTTTRHAAPLSPIASRPRSATAPHLLDLGCGTGSNLRYLAPRMAGPTRWLCVDHDRALLDAAGTALQHWANARAGRAAPRPDGVVVARPGGAIRVGFVLGELACDHLSGRDGVAGVSAAALLDLTSAAWLDAFAARCRGTPLLVALSFDGRLLFEPTAEEDAEICRRFIAHQRTDKGFGAALGPDAAAHLAERLAAAGCAVSLEAADWRLGPADGAPAPRDSRGHHRRGARGCARPAPRTLGDIARRAAGAWRSRSRGRPRRSAGPAGVRWPGSPRGRPARWHAAPRLRRPSDLRLGLLRPDTGSSARSRSPGGTGRRSRTGAHASLLRSRRRSGSAGARTPCSRHST